MKNLKKVLLVMMAIAMLATVGCGKKDDDKADKDNKSEVSDEDKDDKDEEDEDKKDKDDEEEEEDSRREEAEDEESRREEAEDEESRREDEESRREEEESRREEEESRREEEESRREEEDSEDECGVSAGTGDLTGFWNFDDGYDSGYIQFTDSEMIIYFDMTDTMHFTDGEFWIEGVDEEEGVAEIQEEIVDDQLVVKAVNFETEEELVFLVLEAVDGQDVDSLQGRYTLVDSEEESIAMYAGEDMYFYINGEEMLLGMATECEYTGDGTLTMSYDGESEEMTYEFEGETVILTDSYGEEMELTKKD